MSEPLPCPFCGGAAMKGEIVNWSHSGERLFVVMCGGCGAQCADIDTKPEADCLTAWNRRTLPLPTDQQTPKD